jgi:hypothetical protein
VGADGAFSKLGVLLLANCAISDWASLDTLSRLSALTNLRLSNNPVLHFTSIGGRVECVARVPSLRHLNGADISSHERVDCEIRYLRYAMQRIVDLGAAGPAEAARHPRLQTLKERHGDPEVVASTHHDSQHSILDEQLLSIDIVCPGAPLLHHGPHNLIPRRFHGGAEQCLVVYGTLNLLSCSCCADRSLLACSSSL